MMFKKMVLGAASLSLAIAPTAAFAASFGLNLRLVVPVQCSVKQQGMSVGAVGNDAFSLGTFREYCNAPGGYQLVVNYAPGSLRGARIVAGNDEVVLDGSGQAVISRANGPRVRERAMAITPGANGFDTDRLEFDVVAAS